MPSLPANVGTCRVKARFIRALVDGTDDDRAPEGVPLTDLVITIDADLSPKLVRNATADPPVSILIDPIVVHTDANGILVDDRGVADIMIVASNDTDLTPNGWSYRVTIVGPTFPRVAFSFVAPVDGVIDLSSVVPVPPNPGADLVAWQNAVASTLANKAAAQVSAAAAAASAASISPGTANGVAQLGSDSKLKSTQVPAYLDPAALSSTYVTPVGAWAAATAYAKNSLVINAGSTYLATAAVPARTTFTAADWQALGSSGSSLVVLTYASGAYPTRPAGLSAGLARYIGPTVPTTWLANDEWVDNS